MSENERYNLVINGAGQIAGGDYNNVEINGAGNGNGNIHCTLLECNGVLNHHGDVHAQSIEINGTANFNGSVKTDSIEVNGTCTVSNDLNTDNFEINGTLNVLGNVDADNVEINGFVSTKGDFSADNFEVKGSFNIGGLLNAENISIKVFRKCSVREIVCTNIYVKGINIPVLSNLIKSFEARLDVNSIEGDVIHLENTFSKVVRGRNIEIGPNCEVEIVEYTDSLIIDPSSVVKNHIKID